VTIFGLKVYNSRVSDPPPYNTDPDPDFLFNSDPDPALHQGDAILRVATLHASILSVHGPPRLNFEPRELLNFFIQLFTSFPIRIQLFTSIPIRILLSIKVMRTCDPLCHHFIFERP
jgi:hypothetical protein